MAIGGIGGGMMGIGYPIPIAGFKTMCIAGSATAAQMPNVVCRLVKFKAYQANAGNVYIGPDTSVTVAGTADNYTGGWELDNGQETDWLACENLNQFARICDNAGDDLCAIIIA